MKKVLSFTISVVLIVSLFVVHVNAALPDEISPLWDAMAAIEVSVGFVGHEGIASADVSGIHGITNQIDAILILYEEVDGELVYIDSTSGSGVTALGLEIYFDAESGSTYVAELIVTAYNSEGSETESFTDTNTCP